MFKPLTILTGVMDSLGCGMFFWLSSIRKVENQVNNNNPRSDNQDGFLSSGTTVNVLTIFTHIINEVFYNKSMTIVINLHIS